MDKLKAMLIGPPGAGKGTQAKQICEKYGLAHISTGDILRAEIKAGTDLGRNAKKYLDEGQLVPDDIIIGIVENRISQDDCKNGFLFDGFPRTVRQAEALSAIVTLTHVIALAVSEEVLINRISGRRNCKACGAIFHIDEVGEGANCTVCQGELFQRSDDQRETVENRIKVYNDQTLPLIEFYRQRKVLHDIDGDRKVEEVFEDIRQILEH